MLPVLVPDGRVRGVLRVGEGHEAGGHPHDTVPVAHPDDVVVLYAFEKTVRDRRRRCAPFRIRVSPTV